MKIKESVGGLKRYKTYAQIFTSCILYNGCIWFFAANKHVILSLQSLIQFSNLNVYQGFEIGVFISNSRQSYMNRIIYIDHKNEMVYLVLILCVLQ